MQQSSCLQLLYISDLTISLSFSLILSLASPSMSQITRDTWPFVIPARPFWPRIDDAHRILPLCHVKWIRRILLLPYCPFCLFVRCRIINDTHSYTHTLYECGSYCIIFGFEKKEIEIESKKLRLVESIKIVSKSWYDYV